MEIKSKAFSNKDTIPIKYSCDGDRASPPLIFTDIPEGARSLVLIVHDPDAPNMDFVHWLLWNIDPQVSGLKENVEGVGISGKNDGGSLGYYPMCPPKGENHRYFFELYALNTTLDLDEGASKGQLEESMQDHVLEKDELIGLYNR